VNQLQIFKHDAFGEIRAFSLNNEPFFNLYDIAFSLGYTRSNGVGVLYIRKDKLVNICESLDIQGVTPSVTNIQITKDTDFSNTYISESDLYELTLESRAKHARDFRKWITQEVIPTIRKTGSYSIKKLDSYMIDDPIERAKRWIEEQEEKLAIQQQLQIAAPKAEMYDVALSADNAQTMSIVAKTLGYGRNRLFAFLREQGVLRQNNEPYQEFIDRGYFRIRQVPISRSSGTQNKPQTLVTAKGMDYIAKLLKKHGLLKRAL
jgi:anti-repressor protein